MDTKNFLSALSGLSTGSEMKLRKYEDLSVLDTMVKNGKIKLPTPDEMIEVDGVKPQLDIRSVD